MRTFPPSYTYANAASEKYPRFVCAIDFVTPLYLTSHDDIEGISGEVVENVLKVRSAISLRIVPDEGRSEIGVVDFDVLDKDQAFTTALRTKLSGGEGLRRKKVTLYHGFKGADFSQFQVFQTQVVQSAEQIMGGYSVRCADITREQRKDIFDQKSTRLTATISDSDTTISVIDTSAFSTVAHGASFSDAPSSTVGYIRIDKEVISYTGKTSTTFTGCTRGVLNTRAVAHTVDLNISEDRRTEVKEIIYLELPVPKMILALLTGELYGQGGATLPDHWHLGIDPEWVRESDFTGIGTDLWTTGNDGLSFVAVFTDLSKIDGKKFLETELYQLIGCYPIVYSDGTVGIRRMNKILADAAYVALFNDDNVKAWSALSYDMDSLHNDYRVDWNFVEGKATRRTQFIDGTSISAHGTAEPKSLTFKGLYGSRHTDATVRARLDSMRDRYASPPALQTIQAMPRMNYLEVGDIVRNKLSLVRDHMGSGSHIDRSMEIQRASINLATGDVEYELFGSTGTASTDPIGSAGGEGPGGAFNIPDDWYDSEGVDLGTVVDMTESSGVFTTDAGTFAVAGNADATNDAAIYYVLGDLVIDATTLITITGNVQLRVRGFVTINGDISGVAGGKAGVADTSGYGTSANGLPGFGTSRPMDGVQRLFWAHGYNHSTLAARTTVGIFDQVPAFAVEMIDGSPPTLQGLPTDLRGTSGGPGGKVQSANAGGGQKTVISVGGQGGDSGAGLIIVCRGLTLGASGSIDLSGEDSAAPSASNGYLPGAGAPGCPGGLLILLDGPSLSLPDLSGGKFLAVCGDSGAPRVNTLNSPSGGKYFTPWQYGNDEDMEGFLDPALTDGQDLSSVAYRIQYVPAIQSPLVDQDAAVPPPSSLAANGIPGGIALSWTAPDFDLFDEIEIWASASNDRATATLLDRVKASSYAHLGLAASTTRYYWIRARRGSSYSIWEPTGATSGVSGTST